MFGKFVIAAAVAAMLALPATAEARGGHFGGGHFGGGHFGGFRAGGFGGGVRAFAPAPRLGFGPRRVFVRRPFARPFFFGAGLGYTACWRWHLTPFGWRRVWVCGSPYYGLPYYGYPGWY